MTVPPPPAVPGELIEKAAAWLRSTHWDGNGCGTHGTNACSRCYGPSPADAREVAEDVLDAVYGDIVEAAQKAYRASGRDRADAAVRQAMELSATHADPTPVPRIPGTPERSQDDSGPRESYTVADIRAAFAKHASLDDWGVPCFYEDGLIAALRGEYDEEPTRD